MKRSFSFVDTRSTAVIALGTCFIAATYGLVRLAYGLFLPDIQRDLAVSAAGAGYVSAGSSLVYCLAAASGFTFAVSAPRILIACAALTACIGVWGMAAADNAVMFGTCAVISSAGAGLASPALVSIVARNVAPSTVDSAQSIVNAGTGPGLVAAGVLALVLLPEWRLAWVLVGIVTAALAVAVVTADRPVEATASGGTVRKLPAGWVKRHAICLVAAVLMGAGSSAVWTYGRSFLVETGVGSERDTVTAWVALGLGAAAVILTARPVAALPPARAWMLSCALMTCAITILAAGPERMGVALAALLIFGWGFTAATSSLISWTTAIAPASAAAGTAMLFVALVFGQAIGAGVLGLVVTSAGFDAALIAAALLTAAATATATLSRTQNHLGCK